MAMADKEGAMSRSGYSEDYEFLELYRANVDRALKGKRGQKFLKALLLALDALPAKRLISEQLVDDYGEVCAIGALCKMRGIDTSKIDYYDPGEVAKAVGVPWCLAAETEYINDDITETPEQRWQRVRTWVASQITEST